MRRPDYVINEAHRFSLRGEAQTLPAGAFVRPIKWEYLPQHIRDGHRGFNSKTEVFVFCFYGIILIPKSIIREIT